MGAISNATVTVLGVNSVVQIATGDISTNELAGTLQITPLVGVASAVKLNQDTEFRLNGRPVAPSGVAVGQLASVQTRADVF